MCDYVRLSAAAPAKVFGLYPRKGVIAPGAGADIAVVDLKREMALDDATLVGADANRNLAFLARRDDPFDFGPVLDIAGI